MILQKEGKKNSILKFYSSFNKTKPLTKVEEADFLNVLLRNSKLSWCDPCRLSWGINEDQEVEVTTRLTWVNWCSCSRGQFGALKETKNLFLLLILSIFNLQYKFHLQPFKDPSMHWEINRVMRSSTVNFLDK